MLKVGGIRASKQGPQGPKYMSKNMYSSDENALCRTEVVLKWRGFCLASFGAKRLHKGKDPTNHGFWSFPCLGSCNQNVGSLCLRAG